MRNSASAQPSSPIASRAWLAWAVSSSLLAHGSLLLLAPPARGTDNAGAKAGNFLKIATDARGVALGNLMSSMATGVDALRWNPAGLALSESREAAGTHVQYYQGVQIENVGYSHPLGDGGLGVNLFYLSAGTLDGRDGIGRAIGDFKFYDLVGGIGYGRQVLTRQEGADVYIGAQVKIVQETIADTSEQNPAFDAGLMGSWWDGFMAGVAGRNFASGKADFAREISGSAAYALPFWKPLTLGAGATYASDAPMRYNVAAEYRMPEYYNTAVRAGYQNTDELDDSTDSAIKALRGSGVAGLRMGFGFEYAAPALRSLKLGFDYAMAPFGALGIAHTVTVRAKW